MDNSIILARATQGERELSHPFPHFAGSVSGSWEGGTHGCFVIFTKLAVDGRAQVFSPSSLALLVSTSSKVLERFGGPAGQLLADRKLRSNFGTSCKATNSVVSSGSIFMFYCYGKKKLDGYVTAWEGKGG